MAWHRSNETSRRLDAIPGVGPMLATALVGSVADPKAFRSGRNFSAWIGLVPKQHSSGGKDRLGSISKQGDRYLRGLFVAGALAVIRYAKIHGTTHRPWLTALRDQSNTTSGTRISSTPCATPSCRRRVSKIFGWTENVRRKQNACGEWPAGTSRHFIAARYFGSFWGSRHRWILAHGGSVANP
jgi:hypothetical protein